MELMGKYSLCKQERFDINRAKNRRVAFHFVERFFHELTKFQSCYNWPSKYLLTAKIKSE